MTFPNGMQSKTTFWSDFTIADVFGKKAIQDTFDRAFAEWKDSYEYLTELVIVLNLKCWNFYYRGLNEISDLYSDLFYKAQDYAYETLTGEEATYFFRMTN